jgi:hypothetical protein
MTLDDREQPLRFLIHDRDSKFSGGCDHAFQSRGITVIRTPVQAPNANAHAERWVGSVRRECLDRLLIFAAGNSSTCFVSMPAITTGIDRIGHSHSVHPSKQTETRNRCERRPIRSSSATTYSAASSTNTNTRPDRRSIQVPRRHTLFGTIDWFTRARGYQIDLVDVNTSQSMLVRGSDPD